MIDDADKMMKPMNDEVFKYHITEEKNDVSAWVRDVFKDPDLADKIQKANKRKKVISLLEKGMKYYPMLLEHANLLIMKLNNANVPEISGEILMFCANVAYDRNDFEQSGVLFERAYECYTASNLEEYRDLCVGCLLKAAYSHSISTELKLDKEEQLMLKAVELHHKMDKSVMEIENELSELVRRNKFDQASEGYRDAANVLLSEIKATAMSLTS